MGERRDRWIRATNSPLANNITGVLLIAFMTVGLVAVVVDAVDDFDWAGDGPLALGYLAGVLATGAGATLLADRLRQDPIEAARDRGRSWHVLLVAMWVPIGLMFSVGSAPAFAQETEKNSRVGIALTGILGSWALFLAVRELVRRRRADESRAEAESLLP